MSNNIPENLRYSKDHEWVKVDGDVASIGITDYAQHSLGDVVYVDMPRVGDKFGTHEAFDSYGKPLEATPGAHAGLGREPAELAECRAGRGVLHGRLAASRWSRA